jgi:amino acid transporter
MSRSLSFSSMPFSLKRLLLGQPIETARAHEERLPKILALPIFASDAISSTAYATQEIMLALTLTVGFATAPSTLSNLGKVLPVACCIAVLLVIVALSYRQTIFAYPGGGGAYIVARQNLGETPGLIAAASLLIDYVLTVSVSTAAGVAAITSAMPSLANHTVLICLVFVTLVTIANLRGVRESGVLFAIPSYLFIFSILLLLGLGFYRHFASGGLTPYAPLVAQSNITNPAVLPSLTLFLLLRAFSSGCTALSGIEAISNGVTAFQKPEARNAATTLTWMCVILVTLFLGITALTYVSGARPIYELHNGALAIHHGHVADPSETLISVLAHMAFDGTALQWFYFVVQVGTAMILILAANTAFAGFPRLASLLATDRYMPRQLANLGDRLAFNNGIMALATAASILIIVFHGSVTALIALYAIGVFLSFTLSQAGMVKHWLREKGNGWQLSLMVNLLGATATALVTAIITVTKFRTGAWMVVLAIPLIVWVLRKIHAHYRSVSKQLSLEGYRPRQGLRHHVFVLAPDIHRGVLPALQYARSISDDVRALHVSIDPSREERVRKRWTQYSRGVPLAILPSPFRSLVQPIDDYIARLQSMEPNSLVTIIVPEFVPAGWWPKLLHGQAALLLNLRFRFKPGVIVISVPYHIEGYVDLPKDYDPKQFRPEEKAIKDGVLPPLSDDAIADLRPGAVSALGSTPSANPQTKHS